MPRYFHLRITYCLQEESTHFGVRVLTNFALEVSAQFGTKNHTIKINDIYRDF